MKPMRIVTFGTGYVGLVTGTGLSELGHDVLCVDIDGAKIAALQQGAVPIYEPGLADLVRRNQRSGRLHFATSASAPWDEAVAYFIAVGTPPAADGSADLNGVFGAATTIARLARRSALVVIKSTVPVGTCDAVQARLRGKTRHHAVELEAVSNPEFLKEGAAVEDFFRPDRIVLGVRSERAKRALHELYAPLQLTGERIVFSDPRSAELTKYAANGMLAMRVSFMNELSRLCHVTGADIRAVRLGVGADSRIGKRYLHAGPGYGGSCFPKDVRALVALGQAHDVPLRLAQATHEANEAQAQFLLELVLAELGDARGKTVALWGLAYKPETDDVREAPALRLVKALVAAGAKVVAHDPEAGPNFAGPMRAEVERGELRIVERNYDALDGAHALVLLTEWRCYRAPDFGEIKRRLAGSSPTIIDARNVWPAEEVAQAGLRYQGIGTSVVASASATSELLAVGI
jgi:UDPglucose 6-dehydrogenase